MVNSLTLNCSYILMAYSITSYEWLSNKNENQTLSRTGVRKGFTCEKKEGGAIRTESYFLLCEIHVSQTKKSHQITISECYCILRGKDNEKVPQIRYILKEHHI